MPGNEPLRPLFLLSDEPIRLSGDDALGMDQSAQVIAEAALGAATPFTVGIFGAWGHGKTSLLNAARTLLEPVKPDGTITRPHPHVVTVQFNAWRYEKDPHPIVPLVASIARAVKQRLEEDQSFAQSLGEKGTKVATSLYDAALSMVAGAKVDVKGRVGSAAVAQAEGGISLDAGAAQESYSERRQKRQEATQPLVQSWIDQSLYLSAFDDLARLHADAKRSAASPELCDALDTYREDLKDKTDDDGNVVPMLFREALKSIVQQAAARETPQDAEAPRPPLVGVLAGVDVAQAGRWLRAASIVTAK